MRAFRWIQASRGWALVVLAVGTAARASSDDSQLQFSVSMLATDLSFGDTPLGFRGGEGGALPGVAQMIEPFEAAPFSGVRAYGLRLDNRWLMHHFRFGAGVQLSLPRWHLEDVAGTYSIAGVDRLVSTSELSSKDVRVSLGGWFPLGPVHFYGDLVGTLRFISATMIVDGEPASFGATTFGYAVEAGANLEISNALRVGLQAERGLVGEETWGAALAVILVFH